MNVNKIAVSVLIFLLVIIPNDTFAIAHDFLLEGEISPQWTNVDTVNLFLSFSNGKANCSSLIIGKSNTTKITATFTLQRQNANGSYSTIKTWSESNNSDILNFSQSFTVSKGYTYRLSVHANVTSSTGYTESISDWKDSTFR